MRVDNKKKLRSLAAAAVTIAGLVPLVVTAGGGPASAALPTTLSITGHGWGHGRGMGQYGALGYAQDGWTYQQILAHYYGGTTLSNATVASIQVSLTELYGSSSVTVAAPSGHTIYLDGKDTAKTSVAVTRGHSATSSGGADLIVSGPYPNGTRLFAGSVSLPTGVQDVINQVSLVQYVEGVVPRESPASWPQAALEAQAVAARSYALAYTGGGASTICDTGSCQVYGGDPAQYDSTYLSNSNGAVTATGSQVLTCTPSAPSCGQAGQVALTEYSSSTGGWTAGGAFPAVQDSGDATSANPNHTWTTSIPTSAVQNAFPSVGTLQSVTVTSRNGYGDLGGRVLTVLLSGSAGRTTVSGTVFAGAVGLKSDWFAITNAGAPSGSDSGYWVVAANGGVYPFGDAPSYGSMAGQSLAAPVIGMAPTGDGNGYWLVAGDGGVFSFGDARFYGSTGGVHLVAPALGLASTADSGGYWMVASDGGVFSFGDARFYGSTGGVHLVKPVVAMARTADGGGYWMVASDGGVFSFGDARFYGSTAGIRLAAPIVGMVPTSDGKGYWLVASDGGVFAFGDAGFVGSLGNSGVADVASVSPTPDSRGYLLVTRSGVVYTFGDATYFGDPATTVEGWAGSAIGVFTR